MGVWEHDTPNRVMNSRSLAKNTTYKHNGKSKLKDNTTCTVCLMQNCGGLFFSLVPFLILTVRFSRRIRSILNTRSTFSRRTDAVALCRKTNQCTLVTGW